MIIDFRITLELNNQTPYANSSFVVWGLKEAVQKREYVGVCTQRTVFFTER
jgi:hypothetical protein